MRLVALQADTGGCGHIRMKWPAQAMIDAGHDVTIMAPGPLTWLPLQVGMRGAERTPVARLTGRVPFDVIVFQRPLNWRFPAAIKALVEAGVRVVVDIDDDLSSIDPRHRAWKATHPKWNPDNNFQHLAECCRLATAVTVTTPALAQRYGNRRAIVLPNCIPERYLEVKREEHEGLIVGWTGAVFSHPADLDVIRMGVADAIGDDEFRVIGSAEGVQKALHLRNEVVEVPGVAIEEYAQAVAQFDIGIAPLADTKFNHAKSWLKPLDYAACGVPFMMSETPEYIRFAKEMMSAGAPGMIAYKPRDWEKGVKLYRDPSVRAHHEAVGREVAARWTFERHADDWAEAWFGTTLSSTVQ